MELSILRPQETFYLRCNAAGQLKGKVNIVTCQHKFKVHGPMYFLGYITSQQVFRIKSGKKVCHH